MYKEKEFHRISIYSDNKFPFYKRDFVICFSDKPIVDYLICDNQIYYLFDDFEQSKHSLAK